MPPRGERACSNSRLHYFKVYTGRKGKDTLFATDDEEKSGLFVFWLNTERGERRNERGFCAGGSRRGQIKCIMGCKAFLVGWILLHPFHSVIWTFIHQSNQPPVRLPPFLYSSIRLSTQASTWIHLFIRPRICPSIYLPDPVIH